MPSSFCHFQEPLFNYPKSQDKMQIPFFDKASAEKSGHVIFLTIGWLRRQEQMRVRVVN